MTKKYLILEQRARECIAVARLLHDLQSSIDLQRDLISEAEQEIHRQCGIYATAANRAIDEYQRLRQLLGSRFSRLSPEIKTRCLAFEQRVTRRPKDPDQRCFEITDSLEQLREFSQLIGLLATALTDKALRRREIGTIARERLTQRQIAHRKPECPTARAVRRVLAGESVTQAAAAEGIARQGVHHALKIALKEQS